jgi:hypothetical protein
MSTDDDRMDALLRHGAQDYNQPGPTPREEMWTRIQAARRQTQAPVRRGAPVWIWPTIGVAAAALLTAGVLIGRKLENSALGTRDSAFGTGRSALGTTPPAETLKAVAESRAPSAEPPVPSAERQVAKQLRQQTQHTQRRVNELATQTTPADPTTQALSYRLVVLQHLAGTEAMITSFRSSAKRGEVDAQIASWSRELLGTTRMLESSPVMDDPIMKRLLEDLDLVLVQIAQYTGRGTHNSDDLDLIEQSITKRGVIAKLRTTIPARTLPAGT